MGGISDKPSTKLHAPPGGRSNFSLVHDDGPNPGTSSTANKTRIRDANGAPGIMAESVLKDQAPVSPSRANMKNFTQSFSINDGDDSERFPRSPTRIVNKNSMSVQEPAPTSPYVRKGHHNYHSDIFGTQSSLDATTPPPSNINASVPTKSGASPEVQYGHRSPRSPSLSSNNQNALTSPDFGFGKEAPPAAQIEYEQRVYPDELNEAPIETAPVPVTKSLSPARQDPASLPVAGSSQNLNPTVFGFGAIPGPKRRQPPGGSSSIVFG